MGTDLNNSGNKIDRRALYAVGALAVAFILLLPSLVLGSGCGRRTTQAQGFFVTNSGCEGYVFATNHPILIGAEIHNSNQFWTPSTEDVARAEQCLHGYVEEEKRRIEFRDPGYHDYLQRIFDNWVTFRRQYVGIVRNNKRIVCCVFRDKDRVSSEIMTNDFPRDKEFHQRFCFGFEYSVDMNKCIGLSAY